MERNRVLRQVALLCALIELFLVRSQAGQAPAKRHRKTHYPVTLAGIKVGTSTDAAVIKRFGQGYFVPDEGHLGGRYYVDTTHHVTLHAEIGVDRIIESIEYQRGIHLPNKNAKTLKQATTRRLPATLKLAEGIGLGASVQSVLHFYGRPAHNEGDGKGRTITYASNPKSEDSAYEARFLFDNERLTYISLYNGEGD